MGYREESMTLLKSEQIVIAAATIYPLQIKRLNKNIKLPISGLDLAAGIDIMTHQDIIILPDQRTLVNTGITLAAPSGTYARIVPGSGLVVKHEINIKTQVINEDYQGEIKVVLINNLITSFQVRPKTELHN
jgi:dUTP pyrophosphatase